MAQVPGALPQVQVRRAPVWTREDKEVEDNEDVCGPCCSCRRWRGAQLTDGTVQTDRGRADGDGTSNGGSAPGCREMHSCLASRR